MKLSTVSQNMFAISSPGKRKSSSCLEKIRLNPYLRKKSWFVPWDEKINRIYFYFVLFQFIILKIKTVYLNNYL